MLMRHGIQLRISSPCTENWEQMQPEGKGRHCRVCSRTVVDFSLMTDREIISLTTMGLLSGKAFNVYPNPVRRGAAMMIAWSDSAVGAFEIALFNGRGATVEQRLLQVNGKGQADLIELPLSLPTGVYFLRVTRPGESKVVTRKVVLL